MRANVFIASRRSEEGSRLLWRNVPVETANIREGLSAAEEVEG